MTLSLPGYTLHEKIYETALTSIYRGVRETDGLPIIVKTLNAEYPSNEDVAKLRREYQIAEKLQSIEGVITVYALARYGHGNLAILMEPFGQSLADWLQKEYVFPLDRFFPLALQLTATLGALHQANIIHKEVNPRNILLAADTATIRLIDFGLASELTHERQDPNLSPRLEGSLPYISPEQTGRMHRGLDYRSDYYSLGATFYELLTGQRPLEADDLPGWVHAHLSKLPPPPHERHEPLPEMLSQLILKLLAKNPEGRYQSARGLQADLARCQREWGASGTIPAFVPAQQDRSEQFQIPQALYGREEEVSTLLRAFDAVAGGDTAVVLVRGEAGVGKSALVHEIQPHLVRARALFLPGKFNQFERTTPYAAVRQAFRHLVQHLLREPDDQVTAWRAALQQAVGAQGQILLEFLPDMEHILGPQPPVPELPLPEGQLRFHRVVQAFLQVVATKHHPLVLFLDDLQWSDTASLQLLRHLLASGSLSHLLVIGACRDQEVEEGHPLWRTLEEIAATTHLEQIGVGPLDQHTVARIIAETVHGAPARAQPLTALLSAKTQGNPFFLREYLKTLHATGAFTFAPDTGTWTWDLPQVQALALSPNVVDMLVARLQQLPPATQQVLPLAACVGHTFDLHTVALIADPPPAPPVARCCRPYSRATWRPWTTPINSWAPTPPPRRSIRPINLPMTGYNKRPPPSWHPSSTRRSISPSGGSWTTSPRKPTGRPVCWTSYTISTWPRHSLIRPRNTPTWRSSTFRRPSRRASTTPLSRPCTSPRWGWPWWTPTTPGRPSRSSQLSSTQNTPSA